MRKFVAIAKAKKPPRRPTREQAYDALHRIADELAPVIASKIKASVSRFIQHVDLRDVLGSLIGEDENRVEGAIPWSCFLGDVDFRDELLAGVERAGISTASKLKDVLLATTPATDAQVAFNLRNPDVEKWARERSASLIKELTDTSRAAVRKIVAQTIANGSDYGSSAKAIKDAVGLTQQGVAAVTNYRTMLEARNLDSSVIDRQVEGYRDRLLTQRAETISRTETIAATNQGQLEYWNQLADDGIIDSGSARKVWLVTPDDRLCPLCAPLDGKSVPIDEPFITELGEVDAPPLHPNCRCAMSLEV